MFKSFLKFALIVLIAHIVTYFIAGIIAQLVLGANEFYPPSPHAISYLRDPHDPSLQIWILPAQALRGLLYALALFPLRKRFIEMSTWAGGFMFGTIIFLIGYVAASGGIIEHFVYFNEYPFKFAVISFFEILIQVVLMGPLVVSSIKRFKVE
jgi:hypothetical protein